MLKNISDRSRSSVAINGTKANPKLFLSSLKLRVREPVGRSFGSVRGKFPSQKMGRMVHWESQLERDAILIFEFSSSVLSYREQPFRTFYTLDGKTRRYTPDFELKMADGSISVIEVKPAVKLLDPIEANRLRHVQEHIERTGFRFLLLTENVIRNDRLLKNLHMLKRYQKEALTPLQFRIWRERFTPTPRITFEAALTQLNDLAELWNLIAQRVFICDLRLSIDEETILEINSGEANAELYI